MSCADAVAPSGAQLELLPPAPVPSSRRELHALGVEVLHAWLEVGRDPARPLCPQHDVFVWCTSLTDPSLQEVLALVASQLAALGFSDLYDLKLRQDIGLFFSTLDALDVHSLRDVTDEHVQRYVTQPVRGRRGREDWRRPSPAVLKARRTAVRTCYLVARSLGLADGDPTLDLAVPSTAGLSTRPLTDEEELLGRVGSRMRFADTRGPAIWALARAMAATSEIGLVRVRHLDLANERVWLDGNPRKRTPRWGRLDSWSCQQLAAHVEVCGDDDPDRFVVYHGAGRPGRPDAAACNTLIDIFVTAGIRGPDVRPASVAAWAARTMFDQTADIIAVASALGVRSLDTAARTIRLDWR